MRQIKGKHADAVKQQLKLVSGSIIEWMRKVEENQSAMADDIRELTSHCQNLLKENRALKRSLGFHHRQVQVAGKPQQKEHAHFLGLATFEKDLWDDCVEKVKTVIREGVELRDEIRTKRAHRAGKAIVVKFSNQQKMLILKNARLPMNQMVLTMST